MLYICIYKPLQVADILSPSSPTNKRYRDGMLQAKTDDTETVALIDGATIGMVSAINQHGPDAVQEWEVDELLEWTTSLNYDE